MKCSITLFTVITYLSVSLVVPAASLQQRVAILPPRYRNEAEQRLALQTQKIVRAELARRSEITIVPNHLFLEISEEVAGASLLAAEDMLLWALVLAPAYVVVSLCVRGVATVLVWVAKLWSLTVGGPLLFRHVDAYIQAYMPGAPPDVPNDKSVSTAEDKARLVAELRALHSAKSQQEFWSGGWDVFDEEVPSFWLYTDAHGLLEADFVMFSRVIIQDSRAVFTGQLMSTKTWKFARASHAGAAQHGVQPLVRRVVPELLRRLEALHHAEADVLLDVWDSVVAYDLPTVSGRTLRLIADYELDRPNPELQQVKFEWPADLGTGMTVYQVPTREGPPVKIVYNILSEGDRRMLIDVSLLDKWQGERPELLTVMSEQSYPIAFQLTWKESMIEHVAVEPKINPFRAFVD